MPILAMVLAIAVMPSHAQAPPQRYKAGMTHRAFLKADPGYDWRGSKTRALDTVIWYPAAATAQEVPQRVGAPPLFEAGNAAPGAALAAAPRRFPLVLLSHGTGGSALMMAWLGTRLARAGFVAVAVDHPWLARAPARAH